MKRLCFALPSLLAIILCQAAALGRSVDRAPARAKQLRAAIKSFKLDLSYGCDRPTPDKNVDKPYYNLTLSVGDVAKVKNAFHPQVQITEAQAQKIIDRLAAEGFLGEATELDPAELKKFPPQTSHYGMSVANGKAIFYENFGWGAAMVLRLDHLRKALDGDAAKAMDLLLGRLQGHRKEWEREAKEWQKYERKGPWQKEAGAAENQPTPKAAARAEQLTAAIKSFKLDLFNSYVEQDKPYYTVTLSVEGVRYDRHNAFMPQAQISEEQAQKIIDYLAAGSFLDRAEERKP